jgi:hypothetical protein
MTDDKVIGDVEEPVQGKDDAGADDNGIEIETVADDAEPAKAAAEEVEEVTGEEEAKPEVKPEEVEQKAYGKRADKRIKQLWKENKEKEERIAAMQSELEQMKGLANSFATSNTSHIATQKQLLAEKQKLVEREYGDAYESGDKDRLLKAQDALMETKLAMKQAEAMEAQYKAQPHPQIRQVRQPVKPPAPALEWAEKNPWFGKDEVMSTVAMHINNELVAEGYSDKDADFYAEIDSRLRKEMPHKFSEKKPPVVAKTQQGPTVSGQSRSSPNTKKVKLTQSDLAVCKQMGISPETYAKHKLSFEASEDGSVEIGI